MGDYDACEDAGQALGKRWGRQHMDYIFPTGCIGVGGQARWNAAPTSVTSHGIVSRLCEFGRPEAPSCSPTAARFIETAVDSRQCPCGYGAITDYDACEAAGQALGKRWGRQHMDYIFPTGCIGVSGQAQWNAAATSVTSHPIVSRFCEFGRPEAPSCSPTAARFIETAVDSRQCPCGYGAITDYD